MRVAALLWACAPLSAQSWIPVGPPGGDVRSLAADPRDPRRIYLGTAEGVLYRSDDGGVRWQRPSPGFPLRGQSLDVIVVDPRGTLLVGYWRVAGKGGGVASSADGGETFSIAPGMEGQSVRALALAPSDPRTVVAGALDGVFASADGGLGWRRISPAGHAELQNVQSVAVDPRDPRVIYAGTWHLPWKTLDGGRRWVPAHAGMISDSDVFTLTLDRRDPLWVYATACTGIYRSLDGSRRWARVRGMPPSSRRTRAFAQDPDRPDTFYAGTTEGLWTSENGTLGWRAATPTSLVVNAVVALPGGVVLAGCDGAGVLRSADHGRSWAASNTGFSERFVSRMVFDRARQRVLVGIWGDRRHGGVLAAPTPRAPWQRLGTGLEGREVLSLAVAGSAVLAGTDGGLFSLRSGDGAWRLLPAAHPLEMQPRVEDVAALSDRVLLAGTSKGLLRSADAGWTWTRPLPEVEGRVSALATTADDPGLALAATPAGLYRSQDAGATWAYRSAGMGDAPAHVLAILPGSPRMVFGASRSGVYRSSDQGLNWVRCAGGLPSSDFTGLAVHPDGRTLYASDFTWGGVYRSQDRGETWTRLPASGLVTERVWAVGLDPAAPEGVLASSPAGGLHWLGLGVAGAADSR